MRRPHATSNPGRLLVPGLLLLLLALALLPGDGTLVETTAILMMLLSAVVNTHYRQERHSRQLPPLRRRPQFVSPYQLAVALLVVIVIGSLAAILLTLMLTTLAGQGSDGRTLLRVLLAALALAPCVSIGARCHRWWAFSGAALLVPPATVAGLIAGLGLTETAQDALFVGVTTAVVVAVGSLHGQLASEARRVHANAPTRVGRESEPTLANTEASLGGRQPTLSRNRSAVDCA